MAKKSGGARILADEAPPAVKTPSAAPVDERPAAGRVLYYAGRRVLTAPWPGVTA